MDTIASLISGLGVLFVALAEPDAGHLSAGRLCGFRFGLLAVGLFEAQIASLELRADML